MTQPKPEPSAQVDKELKESPQGGLDEKQPEREVVQVYKDQLDKLIAEVEGGRKAQGTFDKRESENQKTIQELQVLSGFQELPDEQRKGLSDQAAYSRILAETQGKAQGLSRSDIRYLSTLPWSRISDEADKILGERESERQATKQSVMDELKVKESPQGAPGVSLIPTAGGRAATGQYKTVDAAVEAVHNLINQGKTDEARKVAASIGMTI